jgi:carnosine N-methyltransferase
LNAPPFFYLDTLIAVDVAIDNNAELSEAILQSGLLSFGIDSTNTEWQGKASSNDLEKARSTLRQFYRDWSKEGSGERAACYNPVIEALKQESSARSGSRMRVLVPGAGLGRLVFELCCAGFHTEGNEISFHQLLASSYILNICPEANKHELHPFVHTFSNHLDRNGHLKSVRIPDVHPGTVLSNLEMAGEMSMSASDFLMLYSNGEQQDRFDAVATVFFLDTSPNIIRYFEAIRNCLKKGGLLINIGPLLWHFENNAPGTHLGGQSGEKGDSEGKSF